MAGHEFVVTVGADRTITIPDELADHLKPARADRLLSTVDENTGAVSVRPLLRSYAGIFAGMYGTPDEVQAHIDAERASWEE